MFELYKQDKSGNRAIDDPEKAQQILSQIQAFGSGAPNPFDYLVPKTAEDLTKIKIYGNVLWICRKKC